MALVVRNDRDPNGVFVPVPMLIIRRRSFYINLPIGGVAAAFVIFILRVPEHGKPTQAPFLEKLLQMDLLGVASITGSIICYLLALQWGGGLKAWNNSAVIGTLIGFILLLIVFIVNEVLQKDRALLLRSLLRSYTFAGGCIFSFL